LVSIKLGPSARDDGGSPFNDCQADQHIRAGAFNIASSLLASKPKAVTLDERIRLPEGPCGVTQTRCRRTSGWPLLLPFGAAFLRGVGSKRLESGGSYERAR